MDSPDPRKRNSKSKGTQGAASSKPAKRPNVSEDTSVEERIGYLRRNAAVIYDSFLHHNLQWGSLSVAWGGVTSADSRLIVEQEASFPKDYNVEQTIYFAGRTDGVLDTARQKWMGSPGELFVGRVAVPNPRSVARKAVGRFQENHRSARVGVCKRLIHPGEVNRIRALPLAPHIIATHTDSSSVFLWNTDSQPNRSDVQTDEKTLPNGSGSAPSSRKKSNSHLESYNCSVPDLELVGHTATAEFALDTKGSDRVLSAGSDWQALMWNINDKSVEQGNRLSPRARFIGHAAPIEDCSFRPVDDHVDRCCSVGQDRCLMLWDTRSSKYTDKVESIHSDDANCCSWSTNDFILTGGSDCVVNVFDVRRLKGSVSKVQHRASVINVRWSPHEADVFLTSDEGANLTIFRQDEHGTGHEVLFRHLGHRTPIVDVQYNPHNAWVLASVSDDSADEARGGGGSLQVWRVSELIYKSPARDPAWARELDQVLSKQLAPAENGEDSNTDE